MRWKQCGRNASLYGISVFLADQAPHWWGNLSSTGIKQYTIILSISISIIHVMMTRLSERFLKRGTDARPLAWLLAMHVEKMPSGIPEPAASRVAHKTHSSPIRKLDHIDCPGKVFISGEEREPCGKT